MFLWSKLFCLSANTPFTNCWKPSKSKGLPIFNIMYIRNTNVGKPGSIWSIFCIISWKIHFTITILNNKRNQIDRSQAINVWNATYFNVLCKHGLLLDEAILMQILNVLSYLWIRCRWQSPCCTDLRKEDTCLLQQQEGDTTLTCSEICFPTLINWLQNVPFEEMLLVPD